MRRANEVVDCALTEARIDAQKGRFNDYRLGQVMGQILVADFDMRADQFIVEGARNEIWFLYFRSRGRHE